MSWDAEDVALLKKLWAVGQSAAQIALRLGYSRNAVCAKLTRLDLKRGHKPPTAKPKIRPMPKTKTSVVGCLLPPGGKDCVAEDSDAAAQRVHQASALRHAS